MVKMINRLTTVVKGKPLLGLAIVLLITIVTLTPAVNNGFVNWGDQIMVQENDAIKAMDVSSILTKSSPNGQYNPISALSLAIDYSISRESAQWFHIHNLFLHLLNVALVFFLTSLLFEGLFIPLMIALLMGIHPVQVDTVAWVSGRGILLSTMYSLMSLLCYTKYLRLNQANNKWLIGSGVCFVVAVLSNQMAITLPVVFLLVDFLHNRKDFRNMILSKLAFFMLSGLMIYTSGGYTYLPEGLEFNEVKVDFLKSLVLTFFEAFQNVVKSIVPYDLSPIHTHGEDILWYHYLSILLIIVGVILSVRHIKPSKTGFKQYAFGFLLFLIVFLPSSSLLSNNLTLGAGQHVYFANIGLFVILAFILQRLLNFDLARSGSQVATLGLVGILLFLLTSNSFKQAKIWESSETLWANAAEVYPDDYRVWTLRAHHWQKQEDYKRALVYYNKACAIEPIFYQGVHLRGVCYTRLGDGVYEKNEALGLDYYKLAINDLNLVVNRATLSDSYYYRGLILSKIGEPDKAVVEYNKALLKKVDGRYYLARGRANYALNKYPEALKDYELAIENGIVESDIETELLAVRTIEEAPEKQLPLTNSDCNGENSNDIECLLKKGGEQLNDLAFVEALATYNRIISIDSGHVVAEINAGLCKLNLNDFENAVTNFSKVLDGDSTNQEARLNRAIAYRYLNELPRALQDIEKAISQNNTSFLNYQERVRIYTAMKDEEKAIGECDRLIKLNPGFGGMYILRAETLESFGYYDKAKIDRQKAENLN